MTPAIEPERVQFNEPIFAFAEVVEATRVEAIWLRSLIAQDKSSAIGTRHRTGRLLFSPKDITAIWIHWALNHRLRIKPAAAWKGMSAVLAFLVSKGGEAKETDIHLGFDDDGAALVWGNWNDSADANRAPHIVLPMRTIRGLLDRTGCPAFGPERVRPRP